MAIKETTKTLCQAFGPSGAEQEIAQVIKEMIEPHCDEVSIDIMGNLVAFKKGQSDKNVMLAAHMDEIGLVVTHIDEDGFVRFDSIGGVAPYRCLYRTVQFANGTLGVVGQETKDKHDVQKLKITDLFIDIGATSRDEALEMVKIGDAVCFQSNFVDMGKRISCAALDDRLCCAAMVEVMKAMDTPADNVYFVFTTQEEVGLRGALTSTFAIDPDCGLALDVTPATGTPNSDPMTVELGKGPAVKIKDRASISHPAVVKWLEDAAKEAGITTQREVLIYGGTDAGAMQRVRCGRPVGTVSIPTRYVHSQQEMADMNDINNTVELLEAVLQVSLPWTADSK